jgi:peptidyl-prolyl cis-trans isomerase A (cyclophilin A)
MLLLTTNKTIRLIQTRIIMKYIKNPLLIIFLIGCFLTTSSFAANPRVLMQTSMGNIELELFEDKAPITVKNFLRYADEGFYNGTIFHRVIKNFMIQTGGLDAQMNKKDTHKPIQNESKNKVKNDKGTIAMARTNDPDSATAQFFINTKDNNSLNRKGANDKRKKIEQLNAEIKKIKNKLVLNDSDKRLIFKKQNKIRSIFGSFGYAVFGKVTKGMDIVMKIEATATGNKQGRRNVPKQTIEIKQLSLIK